MKSFGTVRLLSVEDNVVDAVWLKTELSTQRTLEFDISHVSTLSEARQCLRNEKFDLVLLDLGLPDGQGLDSFLQMRSAASDTPIIVVSGFDDESLAIEAVRHGAQDYLVKDKWDAFTLSRSIAYAIERQHLLRQLRETESSLSRTKEMAKRTTRSLRVLTECHHALTHATEESTFLQEVCRLIVETGGYRMAWIGMAVQDETQTIQPVASAGFVDGYFDEICMNCTTGDTDRGPTVEAICSGVPSIDRHTMLDVAHSPWRAASAKRGYASAIALPLIGQDCIIGALTVYASEPEAFDKEAVTLLTRLADDVSYEQSILEMSKEKEEADRALHESEERFHAMFEAAQDAIFIKNKDLQFTHVNPSMARIFGRPVSEIIGISTTDLLPKDFTRYIKEIDLRVLSGEIVEEERILFLDGSNMVFSILKVPLRNAAGEITGLCGVARNITDWKRNKIRPSPTIGNHPSPAMRKIFKQAEAAAKRDSTLLLLGESGSGKDHLAQYIHEHSIRAGGPFFAINCSAVNLNLAESELFGHEKGAFTGAGDKKRGLLELAEGGTLLLNEIGELPLSMQAKLLTFLDTRKFTRVGGEKEVSVNNRLIAATNRDLEKEVEEGRFRKDLFYRINVLSITLPPLRERLEDIPVLVQELMEKLRQELQINTMPILDSQAMENLKRYHWPGNVRELRNVLERALIISDQKHLSVNLPIDETKCGDSAFEVRLDQNRSLHDITDEVTRLLCREALRVSQGNKKRAARMLRISRDSLYRYMEKFGLDTNHSSSL